MPTRFLKINDLATPDVEFGEFKESNEFNELMLGSIRSTHELIKTHKTRDVCTIRAMNYKDLRAYFSLLPRS